MRPLLFLSTLPLGACGARLEDYRHTPVNRTTMPKFGIHLGELTLFFHREGGAP